MTARSSAVLLAVGLVLAACSGDDDGEGVGGRDDRPAAQPEGQTPDLPEVEGPVTGPGAMYIDPLEGAFPPGEQVEDFGYVVEE